MGSSRLSFDRASEYYDRTRALSERSMGALVRLLTRELGSRHCLEVGVGTGRFALPLHEAGADLMGLDVSEQMLRRLIANSGGDSPFPLVMGDATRLPFAPASFEAVLCVHVLHLIARWEEALDELTTVLSPTGIVLADVGGWGQGGFDQINRLWAEAAGVDHRPPGVTSLEVLDEAMGARGFTGHALPVVVERVARTYAELVDSLEQGLYSFTWQADESARLRGANAVRAWLASQAADMDELVHNEFHIRWKAYRPS